MLVDEVQFLPNALIRGAQHRTEKRDLRHPECGGGSFRYPCRLSTLVLAIKASRRPMCYTRAACRPDQNRAIRRYCRNRSARICRVGFVLPVPPRQIPFQPDTIYYDIRRQIYNGVIKARYGGCIMHTAGEFPLETEPWGVRTNDRQFPDASGGHALLSTTPEHKDSEYGAPVHTLSQCTELITSSLKTGPDSKPGWLKSARRLTRCSPPPGLYCALSQPCLLNWMRPR